MCGELRYTKFPFEPRLQILLWHVDRQNWQTPLTLQIQRMDAVSKLKVREIGLVRRGTLNANANDLITTIHSKVASCGGCDTEAAFIEFWHCILKVSDQKLNVAIPTRQNPLDIFSKQRHADAKTAWTDKLIWFVWIIPEACSICPVWSSKHA